MSDVHGGSTREDQEAWAERFTEDFLKPDAATELRRIADALETLAGKPHCDGVNPETGEKCALGPTHVGYHVPVDGRKPWLDTE